MARPCVRCGTTDTTASHGLCGDCLHATTVAECEAQGVPFELSADQLARISILSEPSVAARRESAA